MSEHERAVPLFFYLNPAEGRRKVKIRRPKHGLLVLTGEYHKNLVMSISIPSEKNEDNRCSGENKSHHLIILNVRNY